MSYKNKLILIGLFMISLFILLFLSFNIKQDNKFNDNLILMEYKSKNYIKYNMLPITSDKIITLEELYNNQVISILYYNLNECNDKSYIIIKPNGLFYEMTTTLICDNKTETIKSYFN